MPKIKQHQVKITLPSDLYSQLVAKNLQEEGEVNLSSYIRKLIRIHLKWN
jgi:hypothetical protein